MYQKKKSLKIVFVAIAVIIIITALYLVFIYKNNDSGIDIASMEEFMESKYNILINSGPHIDLAVFNYEILWKEADVIVLVKAIDDKNLAPGELFEKENIGEFDKHFKTRKADIVKVYKGSLSPGEEIDILEMNLLSEDGRLLAWWDCYPMQKENFYVFFLREHDAEDGTYLPVGINQGKIDLTYLKLNYRKDIAFMVIADLFNEKMPENISQSFVSSKPVDVVKYVEIEKKLENISWKAIVLGSGYEIKGMELVLYYIEEDDGWYFKLGDTPYDYTYYSVH